MNKPPAPSGSGSAGGHVSFYGNRGASTAVQPEVNIPRRGMPAPKSILRDEIRFLIPNVYDPWLPILRQRPHEEPTSRTAAARPFPH